MRHRRGLAALAVAPLRAGRSPHWAVGVDRRRARRRRRVCRGVRRRRAAEPERQPGRALLPEPSIISVAFASDAPVMYASTLTGVRTYDISDPTRPRCSGAVPMALFQNENVKLGERADGTKFVLVGFDTVGVTPTEDPTNVGTYDEIVVVDVTDPTAPHDPLPCRRRHRHPHGRLRQPRLHPRLLVRPRRRVRRRRPHRPRRAPCCSSRSPDQPMEANAAFSTGIGHDWDVDADGVAWWVGTGGIVAYDVSDPTAPVVLNSSDVHGRDPDWNNFISHNSLRPNADAFTGPRHRPGKVDAARRRKDRGPLATGHRPAARRPRQRAARSPRRTTSTSPAPPRARSRPGTSPTSTPPSTPTASRTAARSRRSTSGTPNCSTPASRPRPVRSARPTTSTTTRTATSRRAGTSRDCASSTSTTRPTSARSATGSPASRRPGARGGFPSTTRTATRPGARPTWSTPRTRPAAWRSCVSTCPRTAGPRPTVTAPVLASWLSVSPDLAARAAASPFGGACVLPPATRD